MTSKYYVQLTTDGSSLGNPGPGGYAAILECGENRKTISAGFNRTTNNRMEIMAVIAGLKALKRPESVLVRTDSQYVANAVTKGWLKKWQKNGWQTASKKPVKNKDLWEIFAQETGRHDIKFEWVKGHAGDERNEQCDQLAKAEASRSNLPPDTGYSFTD